MGIEKSIGIGFGKIWYRKKVVFFYCPNGGPTHLSRYWR